MAKPTVKEVLFNPVFANNPIGLQILGICSALAVTSNLQTALVMSLALTLVTGFSNLFISMIRSQIPSSIRMIVQMVIIASLVIVVDQILKAYAYGLSKQLSVFVGLIITNCIVMGRAEAFAMQNPPVLSFWDGIGNGLGYSVVLLTLGVIRELFGAGKLFGADREPTKLRDISQPGQYACEEKVNLVGPRNRIDGVRLLGPLRSKNQVEISRTDEFLLGVDAPIRDSGKVAGSAPIIVEGPAGTVNLGEGLICAKRHIHMTPDDANHFGVQDGDEVEVAIDGGPRDLVFGDVLVRVSPKYKLEMHIDTDEANAAELNKGAEGALIYTNVGGASAQLRRRRAPREE